MNASELNARLAKALGWVSAPARKGIEAWWNGSKYISLFSPATSSDHLREYVLPEVFKRGRHYAMCKVLNEEYDVMCLDHYDAMWDALVVPTDALAKAALKVLEGGE